MADKVIQEREMVEKGQKITLEITDMSDLGQGIGRTDGLAVFVDGAVKGDKAEAEITKVKKRYAIAEMTSLIEPSEHRIEAECPFFAECGGCSLSVVDYEGQLELKEEQLRQKLIRLGGIEDPVIEKIAAMECESKAGPVRFRNKAVLSIGPGGKVGFVQAKTNRVYDCSECLIQTDAAMAAAEALRRFLAEEQITVWNPKKGKGLMRQMIVKTAFGSGEVMVVLVINGKEIPGIEKLVGYLDDSIYEAGYSLESVILNINKDKNGPAMGDKCITVAGKNTIIDKAGGLKFEISPRSFYQTNPAQMITLYDKAREFAGLTGNETVLDLYCGTGTIGLWCVDKAGFVIGIESEKQAILDANRNAVINGITNAAYICGKAEVELKKIIERKTPEHESKDGPDFKTQLAERARNATVAFVDPPRAGCDPALLDAIADSAVERIVYVSCDPATLARDIKVLTGKGFKFVKAAPVDMFPRSTHVETVVLMSRKDT